MPETTYSSYRRNGTNGYHNRNGTNGTHRNGTNGTHDWNRDRGDRDWGDRNRYDWDRNRRYPSTSYHRYGYRYPTTRHHYRYNPPYKWGHYKPRRYNHVYNPWAGYRAPRAWWYDWWDSWIGPWINPVVSWLWPNPILPAAGGYGQQYQPPIIYP